MAATAGATAVAATAGAAVVAATAGAAAHAAAVVAEAAIDAAAACAAAAATPAGPPCCGARLPAQHHKQGSIYVPLQVYALRPVPRCPEPLRVSF